MKIRRSTSSIKNLLHQNQHPEEQENKENDPILKELSNRFDKETPRKLDELRTVIKVDQSSTEEPQKNDQTGQKIEPPKISDIPPKKIDNEKPILQKDLEEKKEYLKAIKDFDFRINENKLKIEMVEEKIKNLSGDLDDLVSLYEIVSDQMNPFVGLSRVTKDRIDALEHYTDEISELKNRLLHLELNFDSNKKNETVKPGKVAFKEQKTPPLTQFAGTTPDQPLNITDKIYSDEELDMILDQSFKTLKPFRDIEQEIIDFLDKIS